MGGFATARIGANGVADMARRTVDLGKPSWDYFYSCDAPKAVHVGSWKLVLPHGTRRCHRLDVLRSARRELDCLGSKSKDRE